MPKFSRLHLIIMLLILLGSFAVAGVPAFAQEAPQMCGSVEFTLWAGQDIDVGTVTVANDDDSLYVTLSTTDGWLLKEAHVGVGTSLDDISDGNGGRPSPGQLPYKAEDIDASEFTFTIPLEWEPETDLYVVAHAAVYLPGDGGEDGQEETAFGGDTSGEGDAWWYYMQYTTIECDPPDDGGGGTGCTPGFWKNHPEEWSGSTETAVSVWFSATPEEFADVTLHDALYLQGGPGVDGAVEILLRAAVAAALNAQYLDYEMSSYDVLTAVNAALESEDRETILALAEELDGYNNGICDLSDSDGNDSSGGDPNEAQAVICHIPPGNPANARLITVGESAVPAHLGHGDQLDTCPEPPAEPSNGNRNGKGGRP